MSSITTRISEAIIYRNNIVNYFFLQWLGLPSSYTITFTLSRTLSHNIIRPSGYKRVYLCSSWYTLSYRRGRYYVTVTMTTVQLAMADVDDGADEQNGHAQTCHETLPQCWVNVVPASANINPALDAARLVSSVDCVLTEVVTRATCCQSPPLSSLGKSVRYSSSVM